MKTQKKQSKKPINILKTKQSQLKIKLKVINSTQREMQLDRQEKQIIIETKLELHRLKLINLESRLIDYGVMLID